MTLRSSPEPEMQNKYTNVFNLGPNQNPAGEPPAYNWYNNDTQTAYELTGPTLLGNLN
jgi:hypothetical protein